MILPIEYGTTTSPMSDDSAELLRKSGIDSSGGHLEISPLLRNLILRRFLVSTGAVGAQPHGSQVGTSPTINSIRKRRVAVFVKSQMDDGLRLRKSDTESIDAALSMSVPEQAREVLAGLSLNKSQLAHILGVSRPTLYSWLDGSAPNPENSDRLMQLLRLMKKTGISGTASLNARFVRQPLTEEGVSVLGLLKEEHWDEDAIFESLKKAKVFSAAAEQKRVAREQRLREFGYEEPSDAERKNQLAKNITMLGLDDTK